MADDRLEGIIERFEEFKQELADLFSELGLGKDAVLRVHGAVDAAAADVRAHSAHFGHDLNDDLAEKPEDHPAALGQGEKPPIQMDEPAADPEVPNQNPERRTGDPETPEPELAAGDPVRAKDEAETPVAEQDQFPAGDQHADQ